VAVIAADELEASVAAASALLHLPEPILMVCEGGGGVFQDLLKGTLTCPYCKKGQTDEGQCPGHGSPCGHL
jgi:hypothetical protein